MKKIFFIFILILIINIFSQIPCENRTGCTDCLQDFNTDLCIFCGNEQKCKKYDINKNVVSFLFYKCL
jgi:hypothetical protein